MWRADVADRPQALVLEDSVATGKTEYMRAVLQEMDAGIDDEVK